MSNEIELLKSQIQDLTNKVKELEEREKRKEFKIIERSNEGDCYYCIYSVINDDENTISCYSDYNDNIDTKYYNSNNYFHTREEAEKYLKRFLLELKILRTRDKINGDWKPDWNNANQIKYSVISCERCVKNDWNYTHYKTLSFETREKRQQFRELITDEEIIEFLNF